MSKCTDKRFEKMLYAYELGMLSDTDRRELELHLLDCRQCNQKALSFEPAAQIIRTDPDIKTEMQQLADLETQSDATSSVTTDIAPRTRANWNRIVRTSLVAAAVLVLLLLKPWRLEFSTDDPLMAAQNRLVISGFENLSDEADRDRIGELTADLLITDLSESHFLQVVSTQHLRDLLKTVDWDGTLENKLEATTRAAEKADARWILQGSAIEDDKRIVLASQLIELSTGDVIATQKTTGEPTDDLFTLIDQLTIQIKNDLSLPAGAFTENDPMVADVTTHSPEAYRFYLDGIDSYSRFYMTEAANLFEKAIEQDSTFAMAFYYLSLLKDAQYIRKAVQYYDHASRKDRAFIRSREAAISGNMTLAVQVLQEAVEQFPQEKVAFYMLGRYSSALGQTDEAIDYLDRATKLDPTYKLPYNHLAYLYNADGDFDNAILAIDKYIELAPDEANPYDTRGEIYAKNGHLDQAISSYEHALTIRPDFGTSLMYLGYMYIYRGDYARGDSLLEAFTKLPSPRQQSAGRLYQAYSAQYRGLIDEALATLDRGIATDIAEQTAGDLDMKHLMKACLLYEKNDCQGALKELETSIELRRRAARYAARADRHTDVLWLSACGRVEQAQHLADSIKTDLEHYEINLSTYWYAQGCIEWSLNKYDSAFVLFDKATRESPDFRKRYWLARAALKTGKLDRAITEFETLQIKYDSPRLGNGLWSVESHYYLAHAYDQTGNYDQAAKQYREFLRIWKDSETGLDLIEHAQTRLAEITQNR